MLEVQNYIPGSIEEHLHVSRALIVTKGNLDSLRHGYTGMVIEFHGSEMATRIEHQFKTFEDAQGWLCDCFSLKEAPDWRTEDDGDRKLWVRYNNPANDKQRVLFLTRLNDMTIADKWNATDNWNPDNRTTLLDLGEDPSKEDRPRRVS